MKLSRALALALSSLLAGCGPGHNYDQVSVYGTAIQSTFIAKGLCLDAQDCSNKEMMFAEGGTFSNSPVHINVYNIKNPVLADVIVEAARSVRSSAKVGLKLRITSSRHLDKPYKNVRRITIE